MFPNFFSYDIRQHQLQCVFKPRQKVFISFKQQAGNASIWVGFSKEWSWGITLQNLAGVVSDSEGGNEMTRHDMFSGTSMRFITSIMSHSTQRFNPDYEQILIRIFSHLKKLRLQISRDNLADQYLAGSIWIYFMMQSRLLMMSMQPNMRKMLINQKWWLSWMMRHVLSGKAFCHIRRNHNSWLTHSNALTIDFVLSLIASWKCGFFFVWNPRCQAKYQLVCSLTGPSEFWCFASIAPPEIIQRIVTRFSFHSGYILKRVLIFFQSTTLCVRPQIPKNSENSQSGKVRLISNTILFFLYIEYGLINHRQKGFFKDKAGFG